MNNHELNRLLKSAAPPPRTEEYWADFPGQVTRTLNRSWPPERRRSRLLPQWGWAFGLATCLAIAFAIGHWSGRVETKTALENDSLTSLKLIHETMAMFPNRVRAIVQDERGLKLLLSDTENVPVSTPIYVRICDGKRCSSLVTFSGQELQIAGQKMTVLSDVEGGVILTGDRFAWASGGAQGGLQDLKIQARTLQIAFK